MAVGWLCSGVLPLVLVSVTHALVRPLANSKKELNLLHLDGSAASNGPREAEWFGDFSYGESTYDQGAVVDYPRQVVAYGKDPGKFPPIFHGLHPIGPDNDQPAARYEESQGGGPDAAWQTFYPEPGGSIAKGHEGSLHYADLAPESIFGERSAWRETPIGYVEDYFRPSHNDVVGEWRHLPRDAQWFDSKVLQYDGYGRVREPPPGSPERCLSTDGWEERAVNTTIKCKEPGCNATAFLQAFDGAMEETCACRLSLTVHLTDFDDEEQEMIEWVKINGQVLEQCKPRGLGCNSTAQTPLFPCIDSYDVTWLSLGGGVTIDAKNSAGVDECPDAEGNLLNGVVTVTCLVRVKPPEKPAPGLPGGPTSNLSILDEQQMEIAVQHLLESIMNGSSNQSLLDSLSALVADAGTENMTNSIVSELIQELPKIRDAMANPLPGTFLASSKGNSSFIASTGSIPLQCADMNCSAEAALEIGSLMQLAAAYGGTCYFSVAFNQTDFDDLDVELIEYIKVAGGNVATDLPRSVSIAGKNPCTNEFMGKPLPASEKVFTGVADYNVTNYVKELRSVGISGKISPQVADCRSAAGNLLDALVRIDCFAIQR